MKIINPEMLPADDMAHANVETSSQCPTLDNCPPITLCCGGFIGPHPG